MKTKKNIFSLLSLCLFIFGAMTAFAQSKAISKADRYKVVINHEEQYSILAMDQRPPRGWRNTKIKGNLKQCQKYIEEVWTDMRPLSIRKKFPKNNIKYGVVYEIEVKIYAIWPSSQPLAKGYKATKFQGSFAECTKHIQSVWTDMRPLSMK